MLTQFFLSALAFFSIGPHRNSTSPSSARTDTPRCPKAGHVPYGTYTNSFGCSSYDTLITKTVTWCIALPPKCRKYTCAKCYDPSSIDPSTHRAYVDLSLEAERRTNAGEEFVTLNDVPTFSSSLVDNASDMFAFVRNVFSSSSSFKTL
jgi:hypothetical protein